MGTKNSLPLPLLLVLVCVTVTFDHRALVIDGKRRVLQSGSIHYPRTTPEVWPEIIRKSKEGGLDVIETYVFGNYHEPLKGQVVSQRNIGDVSSASTATINELSLAPSSWSWYEEQVGVWGNNSFAESGLLEQINTTKDVSDFLWYTKRRTVKCE